jgi:hypothetical protein
MKMLLTFFLFTRLCYNALASVNINPETNKKATVKQENPKKNQGYANDTTFF